MRLDVFLVVLFFPFVSGPSTVLRVPEQCIYCKMNNCDEEYLCHCVSIEEGLGAAVSDRTIVDYHGYSSIACKV